MAGGPESGDGGGAARSRGAEWVESVVTVVSFGHIGGLRFVNPYDGPRREDVTDGRTRTAGRAVRAPPRPPARGRLPDAGLEQRSRRRGAGVVAAAEPDRGRRCRGPPGLADH